MFKRFFLIGAVIVLAIVAIGITYVLRTPAEASEPIQAIAITQEPEVQVSDEAMAVTNTTIDVNTNSAEDTSSDTTQAINVKAGTSLIFEINQDDSQVSFDLDEDLRGVRTTVLGVTDQVAGQIALDPTDLSTLQVGTIQVNARTLATDNDFRNRAIQNEILDTGSYEYITFAPTAVSGLPESVAVNETATFTIVGDLTIRNITQQVTFDVTATLVSATELSGTATTTISRQDYDLTIPSVPQVANVDEAVVLTIDFAADA